MSVGKHLESNAIALIPVVADDAKGAMEIASARRAGIAKEPIAALKAFITSHSMSLMKF
jgi:hypothetical protein